MDLLLPTSSLNLYICSSVCNSSAKLFFNGDTFRFRNFFAKSFSVAVPLQIPSRSERNSKLSGYFDRGTEADSPGLGETANLVEVIGIGSRKDAVLDFCLESSFASSSLRFWFLSSKPTPYLLSFTRVLVYSKEYLRSLQGFYSMYRFSLFVYDTQLYCRTIHMKDSQKVQLLQRSLGKDLLLTNVEGPLSMHSCPRTIILVATAGYGSDDKTAMELLGSVRSTNGLAVGIIVKPFSFEGKRRQKEVEELVNKLCENTNFYIVVETDALLKKEVVTLAEALRSANNAVLLAINLISVLMSDMHPKLLDSPRNRIKELKVPEILRLLENYREAKVGFGSGYNIKSSVARAFFDCPFLNGGSLKDLNGIVICTLASANEMDTSDLHSFMSTFRRTAECTTDIIFSRILEPNLEPNLIVTTLITVSCNKGMIAQKTGFLSGLALRFPFIFSLLGRHNPESQDHPLARSEEPFPSGVLCSSDGRDMPDLNPKDNTIESLDMYREELETLISANYDEISTSSEPNVEHLRSGSSFSQTSPESVSPVFHQNDYLMEGEPASQREPLNSWNIGPGFHIAQEWAKERAAALRTTARIEKGNVYTLPVGVKLSEKLKDNHQVPDTPKSAASTVLDDMSKDSFEAVMDIYNAASTLLMGKYANGSRRQGLLSVRAASMLEAEREAEKKWTPLIEIQYRDGIYKGRFQGGLPQGKGCLILTDGSFYDGMWRYGKRSGLGTFYYSNGDVFQGSWRDDLMHGKGWFYFHTGDRWFANFWKGKANGEGRFYSKSGDIFFGHFRDGWRNGQSLSIDADGTRWVEIWDEGILVNRKQLDTGPSTTQKPDSGQ